MVSDTGAIDQSERIPRLAAGADPLGVPRSPQEGYLLSRVDGCTPWSALCTIGGMSPERVDEVLEGWLVGGILTVEAPRESGGRGGASNCAAQPGAGQIDPCLELSEAFQRRVLELGATLDDLDYFEVLGVARDADARSIKRAYFALSREFHPDRYFRRHIGPFAARLERIFKRVVEAYELLHDPATRSEVERCLSPAQPGGKGSQPASGSPAAGSPQGPTANSGGRMQHLSRLRQSFRPRAGVSAERSWKARRFYQAAELALEGENFQEAAANARLAIAFDPVEESYRLGFAEIQADVHRLRARELLHRARSVGAQAEALGLLEEAIHYRPGDAELSARAARLSLALGDPQRARSHAENAAEIEPEGASHHLLCCRVMRRLGDFEGAAAALERAAELTGDVPQVFMERERLERGARG